MSSILHPQRYTRLSLTGYVIYSIVRTPAIISHRTDHSTPPSSHIQTSFSQLPHTTHICFSMALILVSPEQISTCTQKSQLCKTRSCNWGDASQRITPLNLPWALATRHVDLGRVKNLKNRTISPPREQPQLHGYLRRHLESLDHWITFRN